MRVDGHRIVHGNAPYRLDQTEKDLVARTLSAWSISSSTTIAVFTMLSGVLASLTSPRTAIAIAGVLILATPLLLPRPRRRSRSLSEPAVIFQPPCLTSRQRCTLVAGQHVIILGLN